MYKQNPPCSLSFLSRRNTLKSLIQITSSGILSFNQVSVIKTRSTLLFFNTCASSSVLRTKDITLDNMREETKWRLDFSSLFCMTTQQKTHILFWPDENSIEQCCAAHIVQGCQQYCSTLLHLFAG